jgi:hypothetical protein
MNTSAKFFILLFGIATVAAAITIGVFLIPKQKPLDSMLNKTEFIEDTDLLTYEIPEAPPTEKMTIVLCYLGKNFKSYIYDCLDQIRLFNDRNDDIVFLYDDDRMLPFIENLVDDVKPFKVSKDTPKTKIIREKFQNQDVFNFSLERFLALEQFMDTTRNRGHVLFMEVDNAIYCPIGHLNHTMKTICKDTLGIVRDSSDRVVPGVVYIGSLSVIHSFNDYFIQKVSESSITDMYVLSNFADEFPNKITYLPDIFPEYPLTSGNSDQYSRNAKDFQGLFDGAAFGQYVGGTDPFYTQGDTRGFVNETAVYKLDTVRLQWRRDTQHRKIPVMVKPDGTHIRMHSCHWHCKMIHKYRSKPNYHQEDIVTGERLMNIADIKVMNPSDLPLHVPTDDITTVYVKTDHIPLFWKHFQKSPFKAVIISHNSDHGVSFSDLPMLNHPHILLWMSQNCEISHRKLIPLPIGQANSEWKHGSVQTLTDAMNGVQVLRKANIYCNFSAGTHSSRKMALEELLKLEYTLKDEETLDFSSYLQRLGSMKYVACPRGNGIDTHRLSEGVYMGTTPIVRSGDYTDDYLRHIPAIVIDKWSDVSVDSQYLSTYSNGHTFRMQYWKGFLGYYLNRLRDSKSFDVVLTGDVTSDSITKYSSDPDCGNIYVYGEEKTPTYGTIFKNSNDVLDWKNIGGLFHRVVDPCQNETIEI